MDLAARVGRTLDKYRMTEPGQTVLVAVSGGPDSMALLYLLHGLRKDKGLALAVAHFNHLTRGAESDADEEMVAEVAGRLGLPFRAGRYDVPGAVAPGASLQVVAREKRYEFLREAAATLGAGRVALGHQADDQAETVLQHILRGSGVRGLAGMPPVRGIFIRPLIEVRRRDLESYLASRGLSYRTDPSNYKTVYHRNRVRLELIPFLTSGYNPRLVETLNQLAQACRADEEYLAGQARAAWERMASGEGGPSLELAGLARLPDALAARVVRMAWEQLRGNPDDLSYVQTMAVLSLASAGRTGGVVHLPGGGRVTRTYTHLLFHRAAGRDGEAPPHSGADPGLPPRPVRVLRVPGRTPVPELNCTIVASTPAGCPPLKELPPTEAVLDLERTGGELHVRTRRRGDLFWPLGLPGRIKLKKFFIDRKVPRGERDRWPLVASRDDIVWVAGLQPGHRYRVTESTRRFLHLRLEDGGPDD